MLNQVLKVSSGTCHESVEVLSKSVTFLDFGFSQGSVATYCRWHGNLCDMYIDNFLTNHPVKEFWKLVHVCQSYQTSSGLLFWNTMYRYFVIQLWMGGSVMNSVVFLKMWSAEAQRRSNGKTTAGTTRNARMLRWRTRDVCGRRITTSFSKRTTTSQHSKPLQTMHWGSVYTSSNGHLMNFAGRSSRYLYNLQMFTCSRQFFFLTPIETMGLWPSLKSVVFVKSRFRQT